MGKRKKKPRPLRVTGAPSKTDDPEAVARAESRARDKEQRELAAQRAFARIAAVCVTLALFILYAVTSPRTVALEDDGLFVMASHFLGVAHPPGYPVHTLLGKLFTLLPFGSVAYRVHLLSAVCGAATCGVLVVSIFELVRSARYAILAALAFGLSQVFWSQAIIAEVYTLNTLLFFGAFLAAQHWLRMKSKLSAAAFGVLIGLGLANHWPIFVISSPLLVLLVWPSRDQLVAKWLPVATLIAAATLPYVWMVLRSRGNPEASFHGPIASMSEFLFVLSRKGYSAVDTSQTATSADKIGFATFVLKQSVLQLTPVGALLAAIGSWRARHTHGWSLFIGLVLCFLGSTLGLAVVLGFDYEHFSRLLFRVYPLVAYATLAICLGFGLKAVDAIRPRIAVALGVLVVGSLAVLNYPKNSRRTDDWAYRYAQAVLNSLPKDAVLFVAGDTNVGPIGFLHAVEGSRPDVEVRHTSGRVFKNRLFSDFGAANSTTNRGLLRKFVRTTKRPVYFTIEQGAPFPAPFGVEHLGLVSRMSRELKEGERIGVSNPRSYDYLRWALDNPPVDAWSNYHRSLLVKNFATMITPLVLSGQANGTEIELFGKLSQTLHGGMVASQLTLQSGTKQQLSKLCTWADDERVDPHLSRDHRSVLWMLRGQLGLVCENHKGALGGLARAHRLSPDVGTRMERMAKFRNPRVDVAPALDRKTAIRISDAGWVMERQSPEGRVRYAYGPDESLLGLVVLPSSP